MSTRQEVLEKYKGEIENSVTGEKIEKTAIFKSIYVDLQEMESIFEKVEVWAENLGFSKANPRDQMLKVGEEVGELNAAIIRKDETGITDSIGDVIVTMIVLAQQFGYSAEECLQLAYDEIKDRKGKMVDGVFIKQSDLLAMGEKANV